MSKVQRIFLKTLVYFFQSVIILEMRIIICRGKTLINATLPKKEIQIYKSQEQTFNLRLFYFCFNYLV